MYKVRNQSGILTKDYREIFHVQYDFYKDMYTSNPRIKFDIKNTNDIRLSDCERESLETEINETEIFNAMSSRKKNKACGCDGITLEFYQKFWSGIKIARVFYPYFQWLRGR